MLVRKWTRPPQFPLVVFLVTTTLSAAALGWLSWRLVQQDQALESQRAQERLENAAELMAATLERRLGELEQTLSTIEAVPKARLRVRASELGQRLPDNAVLVVFDETGTDSYPAGRLPYYPAIVAAREPSDAVFAEGEVLELQKGDYAAALERFRPLAKSGNPVIQAGALLRIGRIHRKLGEREAALAAYGELAALGSISVAGLPAELLARHARCELFDESNRAAEAQREAVVLYTGLHSGRWRLAGAAFRYYSKQARDLLVSERDYAGETDRIALADAVESLAVEWQALRGRGGQPAGRKSVAQEGGTALVVWRGAPEWMVGIAAGPRFVKQQWVAGLEALARRQNARLVLTDTDGHPVFSQLPAAAARKARRSAVDTRLPWNLLVQSEDPAAELAQVAARGRLFLAGFALMVVGLLASGYLSARAIRRELAVARLKSDFVSAVSHEFRTPLTSMCQLAEMFTSGRVAEEEQRRQYYGLLAREAQRLRRLVEGLLDFTRMEGGAREYRFEKLDAAELVREVGEEFQQEVADGGYHVELNIDGGPLIVRADSEALRRAFWNLMDNAVKYSPRCFTVWVEADRDGRSARLRVRDHGLGIAPSEQREILKKFVRGASASQAGARGTGIGLSMVQHIVRAHRGSVTVESEPGRGSTFTVLLPLEE
jgi:signal transduction histidine kinase/tetratricopeptide (TPR) repeat protein